MSPLSISNPRMNELIRSHLNPKLDAILGWRFEINIDLHEERLVKTPPSDAIVAQYIAKDKHAEGAWNDHSAGLDLRWRDIRWANFTDSKLPKADLRNAQLQGANLDGAQLQGVNLQFAQLQDANLGYALLQGADLEYAHLQGADLSGAELQGALFDGTKIRGANFTRSKFRGNVAVVLDVKSDIDWDKEIENVKKMMPAEKIAAYEKNMRAGQTRASNGIGIPQFDNNRVLFANLNSRLACTDKVIAKRFLKTSYEPSIEDYYAPVREHIKKNCPPKD